jgi:predicted NAD/FAD-binding protein
MNSLQNVSPDRNYFVTINPTADISSGGVLWNKIYRHPLFDLKAMQAQAELPRLNQLRHPQTFYCGSYFRYGFHEDALQSAYDAARAALGREPWPLPQAAGELPAGDQTETAALREEAS